MQYGNRQNLNPRRNSAYDGPVAPAREAVRAPGSNVRLVPRTRAGSGVRRSRGKGGCCNFVNHNGFHGIAANIRCRQSKLIRSECEVDGQPRFFAESVRPVRALVICLPESLSFN